MSDGADDAAWQWLSPDGKAITGSESELRDKLASRALAPATRVWRSGWAEWLPANRTSALASALPPGTKLAAREPELDPTRTTPPDPRQPAPARTSAAAAAPRAAVPPTGPARPSKPPLPGSLGNIAARTPSSLPPTAPRPSGAPPAQATVPKAFVPVPRVPAGGSGTNAPSTAPPPRTPSSPISHRPVPPPPRSSPRNPPPASVIVNQEATPTASTSAVPSTASGDDVEEVEADTIGAVLTDPPPVAGSSATPASAPTSLEPAASGSGAPAHFSARPSVSAGTHATEPVASKTVGNLRVALVVVSLMAAALVVLLLLSLLTRSDGDEAASSDASSSAAPSPSALAPVVEVKGCVLAVPAAKLAASVERSVPPNLVTLEDGRVAVGFAAKPTHASGIIVDLKTLDARAVFDEPGQSAVRNVAPNSEANVSFKVTRESELFASARSLDGAPLSLLGFTKDALAKSVEGKAPEELWATATDKVTEPRSARTANGHHFVVFRRGGLQGNILAGYLGPDLSKKSELEVVPTGVRYVGTPVAAANARATLIAFAGRDDEAADWRIRLTSAEPPQMPRTVIDFALPAGGPGGGAIAPSLAALDDDRWVLQWTEGGSGQYQVRVQQLTRDLAPVGAPVLASPKGASAGQGAVWLAGQRALSLFVLTVGGYDELWGAALECR